MLITNPGAIRMGSRVLLSLGSALLIAGCTASTSSPSSSGRPVRVAAPTYAEFGDGSAFPLPVARFPEDSARLVGPHYSLQIDRVAFADRLTQDQAIGFEQQVSDIGPMRAAPGHRFMMLLTARHKVTAALENDPMKQVSPDGVRAELRVGGTTLRLPGGFSDLAVENTILMSVPTAGDPVLAVTDSGRTQSLDLATGKRGADAIAGYYPVPKGSGFNASVSGIVGRAPYGLSVSTKEATLQPYLPRAGWAGKGRAWLCLNGDAAAVSPPVGPKAFGYDLDVGASFTLDLTGGGTARGHGQVGAAVAADSASLASLADTRLYFPVPAGFRSGTLRFHPTGSFRVGGRKVSWTPGRRPGPIHIRLHT
ncbi:hypothetical protein [Actinoallomurus iriomotensis]|uniref:Lipoprotein n=1 Tax=Actinoallomurus iriomotensis TaxID=478107 RepID=A0A9W6RSE4_9ACTN|nr:hypothetical protein [Actinoallomurus iriomotensis]GLY79262.1 hypothetical protein Airi01_075290 [Actinoallomurus iriomotensis]